MTKSPLRLGFGITTVAVILSVLCLTIFSVLSLSTAISEKKLSEKSAEAIRNYYAADLECSEIAQVFKNLCAENASNEEFHTAAGTYGAELTSSGNTTLITYSRDIDDSQQLEVSIEITDGSFRITRWQMVSSNQWEPDDSMPVWTGE